VSRVYGEPVEVWVRDDRPVRFVWRGSLFTVSRVLEHWLTTREWWRQQEGVDPDEGGAPPPGEREFWRVEAGAGLGSASGVYELRHDLGKGTWLLSRVWD
jgi:hypothetical protein